MTADHAVTLRLSEEQASATEALDAWEPDESTLPIWEPDDATLDALIRDQVLPTVAATEADPSRCLTAAQVRAALDAHHAEALRREGRGTQA